MALNAWTYCPASTPVDQLGALQYKEANGSGKTTASPSGSSAERIFYVEWASYPQFLDNLLGNAHIDSGASSGTCITRVLPDPHPYLLEFYAVNAQVEGVGLKGTVFVLPSDAYDYANYKAARITANYQRLPFDVIDDGTIGTDPNGELDRFTIRTGGYSSEFMQIANQGSAYKWNQRSTVPAGGNVVNYPPNKLLGLLELNYTWVMVPAPQSNPWQCPTLAAIQACQSKVNSVAFDGYPIGTVLFISADWKLETPRIQTSSYGTQQQQYYTIVYKFAVRNNGASYLGGSYRADHNHIFDPQNNRWDLITSGADAGKTPTMYGGAGGIQSFPIYQATDLNQLFQVSCAN